MKRTGGRHCVPPSLPLPRCMSYVLHQTPKDSICRAQPEKVSRGGALGVDGEPALAGLPPSGKLFFYMVKLRASCSRRLRCLVRLDRRVAGTDDGMRENPPYVAPAHILVFHRPPSARLQRRSSSPNSRVRCRCRCRFAPLCCSLSLPPSSSFFFCRRNSPFPANS